MQIGLLNLFPICAKHSLPLVTWIAVLWHNVFNRIILDNDWSFVPEVFKVAENEVSGTHIVNVTGHKCLLEFLIIRELFIVVAQYEEGLNRIHIIINQILTESDTFLKQLQANIAKAVVSADTLSPDGIQARLEELQKELIKKANNKQDYDAIADEIFRLREQKEQSEVDSHHREETMNRIKELQDFIAKQKTDITEFDEALVKKLIEKITVFADHFTVEFKSGLAIEIEA